MILRRILVPTDFSDCARNAGSYAMLLASSLGAEVVFYHAGEDSDNKQLHRLREETTRLSSAASALPVKFEAVEAKFSAETVREALNRHQAALIVMGSRGEGANLSRKLLGSATRKVIEDGACPVVVVPAGCAWSGITTIAYASDLISIEDELPQVVSFAARFNANVIVFHVTPVFPDLIKESVIDTQVKVNALINQLDYPFISFCLQEMSEDNQVREGMQEFLLSHTADMLVLFHNRNGLFEKYLSFDHVSEALDRPDVPVMVFPKKPA
jgi:nucleotide-binding universal stress UspA family protein